MITVIYGVEGVGKSTFADKLAKRLRDNGHFVARLDGETVRRIAGNFTYTPDGRIENARLIGGMASLLDERGYHVIISAVFPTDAVRDTFRSACEKCGVWVRLVGTPFVCREHGVTDVAPLKRRSWEMELVLQNVDEQLNIVRMTSEIAWPYKNPSYQI